jgi:hypothetical protein
MKTEADKERKIEIDLNRQVFEIWTSGWLDYHVDCPSSVEKSLNEKLNSESRSFWATSEEAEHLKISALQSMLEEWEYFTTSQTLGEISRVFLDPEMLERISNLNDLGIYLQHLIDSNALIHE